MDFDFSEEQELIQQAAAQFSQARLEPIAAALDRGEAKSRFKENLKALAELGFMGLNVKGAYGGSEAGTIAFSLAITEIAKSCAATAVTVSVTNMVGEVIQAVGSEAQKSEFLPKLCSGDYLAGSFCLSEADAGSDPSRMKTRALRDGDDWLLTGTKSWITSGAYAGLFVVWAVTDPDAPSGKGISCFLVEADRAGIEIGPAEDKMGQVGSETNTVIFEGCRVPSSAMLGSLNDGFRIAVGELAGGRIGIASLALGIGSAAIDYAIEYAGQREQFGQTIASMQGPQWMLADAATELEAARWLTLNAAYLKDAEQPFSKQASMAKLFASERANQACYTALQLAGGLGYTRSAPLERYSRDVRVTSIYEGTSEIQRLIIARALLADT